MLILYSKKPDNINKKTSIRVLITIYNVVYRARPRKTHSRKTSSENRLQNTQISSRERVEGATTAGKTKTLTPSPDPHVRTVAPGVTVPYYIYLD